MFGTKSSKNLRFSIIMKVFLKAIWGWVVAVRRAGASVAELHDQAVPTMATVHRTSKRRVIGFSLALVACAACALSFFLVTGSARSTENARSLKRDLPLLSLANAGPRALLRSGGPRSKITLASVTFDKCIQDDTDPSKILRFSSSTGAFQFTQCDLNPPVTMTGTGTVTTVNSCVSLSFRGSSGTISAGFTNGCTTGTATIQMQISQGVFRTFTIHDGSTLNDTCNAMPVVNILTPNGGETVDAGSTFSINWSLSDTVSVVSQDIMYSTDGGSTFTSIITGLAPTVTSYNWTVPSIANNQNVKIRVAAHDASCNMGLADSASPFTVWNPGVNFTHLAEAPFYMVSDDNNSIATFTNVSSNPVTIELTMRAPAYGTATPDLPTEMTLASKQVINVNLASLLNIPTPADDSDPNIVMGSIRLRHNGASDGDIMATVATDHLGSDQSFTTPFIYPGSFQSASDGMQCGPMYYIGPSTSCYLAIQNTTNTAVPLALTVNYGTGAAGTPNGSSQMPLQMLYPQETAITDLSAFSGQLGGTQWGSVEISSPPQSIVAHCVSMSLTQGFAFNSNFIAPSRSASTMKVASPLKIDPVNGHSAYIMICNMATAARTVTATFNTGNGVTIAPQTVTVGAGQQQMIEVASTQVSTPTYADARLTYSGSPSDIVAGACSMSPTDSRALAANFVEPIAGDGRHLMSPLLKFGPETSGLVQISNVSNVDIKAGLKMRFAGSSGPPSPTSLITVPANGTATVDLQKQFYDRVPDGTTPSGSVDLIYAGAAGSVTASYTAVGNDGKTPISQGDPFVEDQSPIPGLSMYPAAAVVIPGECTEIDAITDGTTTPSAQETSLDQCFGEAYTTWESVGVDPTVYYTTSICVPVSCGDGVVITPPPGGGDSSEVDTSAVKNLTIVTALGGRLDPDGNTAFTITSSTDTFQAGNYVVEFDGSGGSVQTVLPISADGSHMSISGSAPANSAFIGNVGLVKVFLGTATGKPQGKIQGGGGTFYAYPQPTGVTATPSLDRAGGTVTISGSGFRVFNINKAGTVYPFVEFDGGSIVFKLDKASITSGAPATFTGKLKHAAAALPAGLVNLKIANPGNQAKEVFQGAYTLMPGPAAMPTGISPSNGPSSGGTQITVTGRNMYVVSQVSLGNNPNLMITSERGNSVVAVTPHDPGTMCPIETKSVNVDDLENFSQNPEAGKFNVTPLDVSGPPEAGVAVVFGTVTPLVGAFSYSVGPCETVSLSDTNLSFGPMDCGNLSLSLNKNSNKSSSTANVYDLDMVANATQCGDPGVKPSVTTKAISIMSVQGGASKGVQLTVTLTTKP